MRRIDKSSGTLTIKHGAVSNLEMPAMTMVFKAADPAMLAQVSERIRFSADNVRGVLTATRIRT